MRTLILVAVLLIACTSRPQPLPVARGKPADPATASRGAGVVVDAPAGCTASVEGGVYAQRGEATPATFAPMPPGTYLVVVACSGRVMAEHVVNVGGARMERVVYP